MFKANFMKNKNRIYSKKILSYLNEDSIRKTWERVGEKKQKDIADVSLGNPTAIRPPLRLINRMRSLLQKPLPNGLFSYMDNAGFLETRKAVAKDLIKQKLFSRDLSENNIIMTSGASGALNCILLSILNPKDEVIILSPYFVDFPKYVKNFSGAPIIISLKPPFFDPDIDEVEKAITKKTKAIIINSPNNPTGKIYSKEKLDALSKLLKRKSRQLNRPIYLISDEVYREIVYKGNEFFSPCTNYDYSIMVYSYSKSLNIPGERIGYAAVNPKMPNGETLFQLIKLANRILGFTNAPALIQMAIPKILPLRFNVRNYQKQKEKFAFTLKNAGFEFSEPEGAFYFFVKLPFDEESFMRLAQREGLYIVNSKPFGRTGYFRIAFCVPEKTVDLACRKISKIGRKYKNKFT